jgi:hypothetical protein
MAKGVLGFTASQRRSCELALDDKLELKPYTSARATTCSSRRQAARRLSHEEDARQERPTPSTPRRSATLFLRSFAGQYLCVEQQFVLELNKENLVFTVEARSQVADLDKLAARRRHAPPPRRRPHAERERGRRRPPRAGARLGAAPATDAPRGVLMNSSQIVLKKAPGSHAQSHWRRGWRGRRRRPAARLGL